MQIRLVQVLLPVLLFFSTSIHADSITVDAAFFDALSRNYDSLDETLIRKSAEGHIVSGISLSKQMLISGDPEQINKGEALLRFLAQYDPRALFELGRVYRDGVEVFPAGEAPDRLLRDYEMAASVFLLYMDTFGELSEELTLFAYAFAGESLAKSRQYDAAASHLLSDLEKAKRDPFGIAAYTLGNLYMNADGVEEDYARALYWFDVAAEKGLGIAEVERNYLRMQLSQ